MSADTLMRDRSADLATEDVPYCWKCGGAGFIVVCWDDLCCGQGECMHSDGEMVCPDCNGDCRL